MGTEMVNDPSVWAWLDGLADRTEVEATAAAMDTEVRRLTEIRTREQAIPGELLAIDRELAISDTKARAKLLTERLQLMAERESMPAQIRTAQLRLEQARSEWSALVIRLTDEETRTIETETAELATEFAELSLLMRRQDAVRYADRLINRDPAQAAEKSHRLIDLSVELQPSKDRLRVLAAVRATVVRPTAGFTPFGITPAQAA